MSRYRDGTVFGMPESLSEIVGVVSANSGDGVILVYFFKCSKEAVDAGGLLSRNYVPQDAKVVALCGDRGLLNGRWPVIGLCQTWERSLWPMPLFFRSDGPSKYVVCKYIDSPLMCIEEVSVESVPDGSVPEAVFGYQAMESYLAEKILRT